MPGLRLTDSFAEILEELAFEGGSKAVSTGRGLRKESPWAK